MTNSHPITIAAESWSKLAMDREKITKYLIVPPYLSTKTDEGAFLLAICHVQLGNYMEAKRLFEKAITAMLEEPRPHWKAARPHWLVDVCILSGRDDLYADVRRELDLFRQGGKGNSLLFLYSNTVMEMLLPSGEDETGQIKVLLKYPKIKVWYEVGLAMQSLHIR